MDWPKLLDHSFWIQILNEEEDVKEGEGEEENEEGDQEENNYFEEVSPASLRFLYYY